MKFVATVRPIATTEIRAEAETLALARVQLDAQLPAGYQILAIRHVED
jgi:hypothetical protein